MHASLQDSAVAGSDAGRPSFSLVLPCFNEEDGIQATALRLIERLSPGGAAFELILVDNGSTDHTGEAIDALVAEGHPVVKGWVEVNEGYGSGVLAGLRLCSGDLVGFMCADEQVEATDVAKLYQLAAGARRSQLFKVRRRFRMDGAARKAVSLAYNLTATLLYGSLGSLDLNANPKILRREEIERMNLQSRDWFLDLEVMIKAKRLGLPVYEMNVVSQMRLGGSSNVRAATCWEFAVNLIRHRLYPRGRGRLAVRAPELGDSGGASR